MLYKHLGSAAIDLAWYQYLILDVAVILSVVSAITDLVSYLILKKISMYLFAKCYK